MPNATALLGVDEFGAADTVTCDNGYAFPDGRTQNVLTCAASGEWEPKDDRCLGNDNLFPTQVLDSYPRPRI